MNDIHLNVSPDCPEETKEALVTALKLAASSISNVKLAWEVEIDSLSCIVFAATKSKAQFIAVRSYWDAYGRRKGVWPRAVATRAPRFDKSYLRDRPQKAWTREYVESTC